MSIPDPKLLAYFAQISETGQRPELIRETEWSYVYKLGEKSFGRLSKFFLDENFTVPAAEFRVRWPQMNDDERLDFVSNFWVKPSWSPNDTDVLDVIMQDGNDLIWESCALGLLRHSDRERTVAFLIKRLEERRESEPLNYIQALGLAKDKRATSAIRPYFDKYQVALESERNTGVPTDVVFGPIPYHAYFVAAGALLKIEEAPEYENAIRSYLSHSNEQVRRWAEMALQREEGQVPS